jgi:hypothetical protein
MLARCNTKMPAVLFDPFDSTDAVVAWTKAHRIAMKVSVVKSGPFYII